MSRRNESQFDSKRHEALRIPSKHQTRCYRFSEEELIEIKTTVGNQLTRRPETLINYKTVKFVIIFLTFIYLFQKKLFE